MRSRAWRKQQKERLKNRRKFIRKNIWSYDGDEKWVEEQSQIDVRKRCSCHCCGNPRKWFKELTWQETKANKFMKPVPPKFDKIFEKNFWGILA